MDDFNRQKIVFSRISGDTPSFAMDEKNCSQMIQGILLQEII